MKKTNKKNSTMRKLLPAFAMLTVSAISLTSATYAWFTMNKDVTVTGMKLKATADDGLVISDHTKADWATSWNVNMSTAVALSPTSVNVTNAPTFTSAQSRYLDDADMKQAAAKYNDLTLTWNEDSNSDSTNDQGTGTSSATGFNYVLLKNFYIKATGEAAWEQNLVIDEVTATASGTDSTALNKSLRVLVVVTDSAGTKHNEFIYAPFYTTADEAAYGSGSTAGSNTSYYYKESTSVTAQLSATDSVCSNITSIPITDAGAINVKMYMYFEGEDSNCKSTNISGITVDDITVSAKFKTQNVSGA